MAQFCILEERKENTLIEARPIKESYARIHTCAGEAEPDEV